MKKRRRIEITTYCRRTSVVLQNRLVGGSLDPLADPAITAGVTTRLRPAEAAETTHRSEPLPANSLAISRFIHRLTQPKAGGK